MSQQEVRKKTKVFGLLAIILAASFSVLIYYGYVPSTNLKTFSSYWELNHFVTSNTPEGYHYYHPNLLGPVDQQFSNTLNPTMTDRFGFPTPVPSVAPAPVAAAAPAGLITSFLSSSGPSYSKTNVQVAGVDEADTVKTDGYSLYLLDNTQNTVYIIDANPANASLLAKIPFGHDTSLAGIYLSRDSNRLAVLGSKYTLHTETSTYYAGGSGMQTYTREYYDTQDIKSFIEVYDITQKARPSLVRDFAVSGSYFNSRMISDYIYMLISQPVQVVNQTVTLPTLYEGAESSCPSPSNIYYVDRPDSSYDYYTFTSIVGLDILHDSQEVANLTMMMGGASNIYASSDNFYLTFPGASTYSVWSGQIETTTEIYRINVSESNLTFDARATVTGSVLNQYSMDEFNRYFRIATTTRRQGVLENNVYVLDPSLRIVGKLESLAPGENLHSARFMGDQCYLVTFKKTDPLFVIDLSQPDFPKVQGELEIPGYSDYLHPYDETHLIGVGKETEEAAYGDFAWYQGLKLSLFDVSNVSDPKQIDKTVIGDRGTTSQTLSDPKAFLFDKSRNLLVIPVNLAVINRTLQGPGPSIYGDFVWQGAYVYNITLDGGFSLKGTLTHTDPSSPESDRPWTNSGGWITRALYIDNTLFTISDKMIMLNSLDDMAFIAQVNLN